MLAARTTLIPLALLLVMASTGGLAVWQAEQLWASRQREVASQVAVAAAFALEQEVSRSLSAAYSLAAQIHNDPAQERFDVLARELLPTFGAVSSLQLAPGGVIRNVYPLAGNEAVIGRDLLHDADRRFDAGEAIRSRRLVVSGPFELRQGGMGLVGRLAVFLREPREPGGERLWGLVAVVVRIPALLEAARLGRLNEDGYRFQLFRQDPRGPGLECFSGCQPGLAPEPVSAQVAVANGAWTMAVAPAAGWPVPPWRWVARLLVAVASLLLGALAWQVVRQPERLRREVQVRTAELDRANLTLAEDVERLRVAEAAARRAEEQLRQAQKMEAFGQLAGGIAHDFNNLLTGVLGHASLLVERLPAGSEHQESAAIIVAAARQAAELTRQLLGFARRRPLKKSPFDAHQVLAEVVKLLARTLDARIQVTSRLEAPRAVVIGDAGQLQQALINLAVNARDAMPEGGQLRFRTSRVDPDAAWAALHPGCAPGPHLVISVGDTGHGIPHEIRDRIFEPFFTTKEPGRGTGLGLAMVYGVARGHGGTVEVESAPGQGATFRVWVPLAEGVDAPAGRPEGAGPGPQAQGRVLVVDDDPVPRRATAALLRALGYQVEEAQSGEEALGAVAGRAGAFQAVVLDVAMPGMDGVATFHGLRRLDPTVPVLFVSGYAQDDRPIDMVADGEARFLAKPFDRAQLAEVLGSMVAPTGG
jgi:two-component system cell cycle sensor histidine kinase/response regulator CckA